MKAVHPSLSMSATELAQAVAAGEMSSREIVEAHIARIDAVNPVIRALVADRFEAARAEADAADLAVREQREDLGPLHGVPCTIKECFSVTGMPWTSGTRSRAGVKGEHDAVTVARLRKAGAIVLGVTNLSELCMWMESFNPIYGRTNNPWDPRRTAGGSSGGEGAIVGAGASPFGLGSDVGGSIRMPAFFNGIWGHKPSTGLVPNTDQYPSTHNREGSAMLGTGPLCRDARDLPLLLGLLAGPDGVDPACDGTHTLQDVGRVEISGLRVLQVQGDGRGNVDASLVSVQQKAADTLASLGASVHEASFPLLRDGFAIWSTAMETSNGAGAFRQMLGAPNRRSLLRHIFYPAEIGGEISLPAAILGLVEDAGHLSPALSRRAQEQREQLREVMTEAIGEGVMLYPSHPVPAPFHGEPLTHPFRWVYTAVFNALGFGITQVPMGLNRDGVPVGIQVIAGPGRDHIAIAVGQALARAGVAGWRLPEVG